MKVHSRRDKKETRKQLRHEMPPAEQQLWQHLRGRQLEGIKFRRQQSIGRFVVDFYAPECRLVIELDGDSHFDPVSQLQDKERQHFIEEQGLRFLRFTNMEVYESIEVVLERIQDAIKKV